MEIKPTLVILAAGLGSRYGSLKQMDQFGPNGETMVDYAIFDAIAVGFKKLVFVISRPMEAEFKAIFVDHLRKRIEVVYVLQELEALPESFSVPADRQKPWGTGHALLQAGKAVSDPFGVINADDYYGRAALQLMYDQLLQMQDGLQACLIGYRLSNTLSQNGSVSRGICSVDKKGFLEQITERTKIFTQAGQVFFEEENRQVPLTGQEVVSMNLMGFTPAVFTLAEAMFKTFLENSGTQLKTEFYMPSILGAICDQGIKVPVVQCDTQWFGVTYKADKAEAQHMIEKLISSGAYPEKLWK